MVTVVISTVGLFAAAVIVLLVRRDRLHTNHAMAWLVLAAGLALLGFAPGIIDAIAHRLGIAYPPTLALLLALVALTIKLLVVDIEYARLQNESQRTIQRLAILESELESLRERLPSEPAPGARHDSPGSE